MAKGLFPKLPEKAPNDQCLFLPILHIFDKLTFQNEMISNLKGARCLFSFLYYFELNLNTLYVATPYHVMMIES